MVISPRLPGAELSSFGHRAGSDGQGVAPGLLSCLLPPHAICGLVSGRVWIDANAARPANAPPFAHDRPAAKQIPLNVEPVEPAHVPRWVDTMKGIEDIL